MPLDHFVSQVHLRNFYSPKLGQRFYGIKKADLKIFPCRSEDVCRIKDGNTNPYMQDPRAIEEFLADIEPKYNRAIQKLANNEIDPATIYVIAGFVAYVLACSPASARLQSEPLKHSVMHAAELLENQGELPPVPEALGASSLTELLRTGVVNVEIDSQYPKAIGISNILGFTSTFGNFHWEVLVSDADASPFFTSDFPVAIEPTADPTVLNRIVPLAPHLALRVQPHFDFDHDVQDFSFPHFRNNIRRLTHHQVGAINRNLVRCAETMVFCSHSSPWIESFVRKNANYRIETTVETLTMGKGELSHFGLRVRPRTAV